MTTSDVTFVDGFSTVEVLMVLFFTDNPNIIDTTPSNFRNKTFSTQSFMNMNGITWAAGKLKKRSI